MLKEIISSDRTNPKRRTILLGAAAATTSGLLSPASAFSGRARGSGENYSLKAPINVKSPEANLLAYVRLIGDVTGKRTFGWSTGQVHGTQEGKLSKLLCHYESVSLSEFKRLDDGSWIKAYRGVILMTDPATGKVIDEFRNPYTNKDNKVIHFRTAFGSAKFTVNGAHGMKEIESESPNPEGPFVMAWNTIGDDAWVTYDERIAYRRPDGAWRVDNAVYRYRASVSELTDPEVTAPHHDWMWSTELNWFTYMDMSDIPGHILWAGMGRKYNNVDSLPSYLQGEIEQRYPGFLNSPIDWSEIKA